MKYKKHLFMAKFHNFFAHSGGKAFDSIEKEESSTTATRSKSDLAKKSYIHLRMWGIFLFYLLLSYLLFASSMGFDLTKSYLGLYSHDQISYIWELYWWPYAIGHHINPLFSTFIWH